MEPVKGNLRLSGYSACGQDGGVQLPRGYIEGTIYAIAFLVKVSRCLIYTEFKILPFVQLLQRVSLMLTWFFW